LKKKTLLKLEEDNSKLRKINISEQIPTSETLIATTGGPSGDGIRRVDSEGHSVGVDQKGETIFETIEGRTVQNEEGTRLTCQILMEKLNELGGDWVRLESPIDGRENGVDGRLFPRSPEKKPLEIQVTKADSRIWGELAKSPSAIKRVRDLDSACESLHEAIEKKKLTCHPEIILALEAVHCPLPRLVADHFIDKCQKEGFRGGFKEIWLVGPNAAWTYKLI
jgi:hypothetical protein